MTPRTNEKAEKCDEGSGAVDIGGGWCYYKRRGPAPNKLPHINEILLQPHHHTRLTPSQAFQDRKYFALMSNPSNKVSSVHHTARLFTNVQGAKWLSECPSNHGKECLRRLGVV